MLEHLRMLSRPLPVEGHDMAAIAVYCEPEMTPEGVHWRTVAARDCGVEGVACVDDVARAAVLALHSYQTFHNPADLETARRWLNFVTYMQEPDGRFANFITDWQGTKNRTGPTSYPGGEWWTGRALWALGTAYAVTGEEEYARRFRLGWPERITGGADLRSIFLLAVLALLERRDDGDLRRQARALAEWIAGCGDGYLRHTMDDPNVHLWGYEQLHALAKASRQLRAPEFLEPVERTARSIVPEIIAHRFYNVYPSKKWEQCAYSVSPLARGLAELYTITRAPEHGQLALAAGTWFYGRNDAGTVVYDPTHGRCMDTVEDGFAKHTYGAESAIEAGLAELARRKVG